MSLGWKSNCFLLYLSCVFCDSLGRCRVLLNVLPSNWCQTKRPSLLLSFSGTCSGGTHKAVLEGGFFMASWAICRSVTESGINNQKVLLRVEDLSVQKTLTREGRDYCCYVVQGRGKHKSNGQHNNVFYCILLNTPVSLCNFLQEMWANCSGEKATWNGSPAIPHEKSDEKEARPWKLQKIGTN